MNFGHGSAPRPEGGLCRVVEAFAAKLVLKIKNKLKYILRRDQIERMQETFKLLRSSSKEVDKAATGQARVRTSLAASIIYLWIEAKKGELSIHEIEASLTDSIPRATLNLTPDSYNALVGIYSVIAPDSGPKFAQFLFEEKENILRQSYYSHNLACEGQGLGSDGKVETYQVVLSGHYLYFYSDKLSLLPAHYMHVLNIKNRVRRRGLGAGAGASGKRSRDDQTALLLHFKNGEEIVLDFGGRNQPREAAHGLDESHSFFGDPEEQQHESIKRLSDSSEGDQSEFLGHATLNDISADYSAFDESATSRLYVRKASQMLTDFEVLLDQMQSELLQSSFKHVGVDDKMWRPNIGNQKLTWRYRLRMKKQKMRKNDASMASMVTLYETYFMKIFKLLLDVGDFKCRIFKTEESKESDEWCEVRASKLRVDIDCLCFETNTKVSFDQLLLSENL